MVTSTLYIVSKLPLLFKRIKQSHDSSRLLDMSDRINPSNRNVGFVNSTPDSLFNNKKTCLSDSLSHFLKFHYNDTKAYKLTSSPNSSNIGVSQFCFLFCFHTIVLQQSVQCSIACCEVPILFYHRNTHNQFVLGLALCLTWAVFRTQWREFRCCLQKCVNVW
jgi:hypothetical protein